VPFSDYLPSLDPAQILPGYNGAVTLYNLGVESLEALGTSVGNLTDLASSNPGSTDATLLQSKYDFTQRMFPQDLGEQSVNGHYMVLNINAQTQSTYNTINGRQIFSQTSELSKTDALRYNIDTHFVDSAGNNLSAGNSLTRPRFTRRIVESIALYMPNSELSFTDAHDFDNVSLTNFGAMVAGGAAKFIGGAAGGILGARSVSGPLAGAETGAALAGSLFDTAGQIISNTAQIAGSPINPKVEVLFANTAQRQFAFDFLFAPTSEKESIALEQIIRTIRFHAAPELRSSSSIGTFFYIPPSEFDLTFFYRGVENTRIPRINTCVLEQCDVSYAPTGVYSTFHNGYPVTVRMMLRFRETEVVTKGRILQGL